jgi:AP-3 complex subunit delta-1
MSSFSSFNPSNAVSVLSDAVFTKSLPQMIKGIRGSKDKNQHEYIAQCLSEIKKELTSVDQDYKTEALKKLIFLQMMGYDMSWAAFHIIEVMSFPWFGHRRVGYLAASLAFNQTTDLILLTTNLLQKAFQQQSIGPIAVSNPKLAEGVQYELGSAISCFSSIVTPALANDLLQDVMNLLSNSRPYVRKRAILALYSIFHKHPPALRIAFDSLLDKLGDENASVNSSVVYVLCELISKTPRNYIDLAPQFFHILTSSSNNWVLIKIVKIMGYLVPFEPRLSKKLQEPLCSIITTTPAKSLMYECINTLLCGQIGSRTVVRLCLDKLRELVESPDQNLKYLGLLGLHKLINSFPRIVVQHKDLILDCLNDHDITIRTRALDLVQHLVTPNNLPGVVRKLLQHINALALPTISALNGTSVVSSTAANQGSAVKSDTQLHSNQYQNIVITKILELCCQDQYSMIADFEWFLYTLLDFTRIKGVSYENVLFIQHIIKDLLLSIPDLRPFGINQLCTFVLGHNIGVKKNQDNQLNKNNNNNSNNNNQQTFSTCHLLQDVYQYTLLHELQLSETMGHYTTMENTTSKLKKQALQQIHNQKQHQFKQISSTYLQFNPMVEVLSTLSWCIGEYITYAHSHQQLLQCFLLHPCIPYLSSTTQSSFLFSAMKIFYNTFQQPWFHSHQEANDYELEQMKLYKIALQQARSLRQNSILPQDFNIDDAENYNQRLNNSDNDEDDDEDDDDEDDENNIKGGHMALSHLGHNIAVGRTFSQHVAFLEQSSGLLLRGLNMFIYHTPYPEVQDRAHILFNYCLWFFSLFGPEFNSSGTLTLPQSQPQQLQPQQSPSSPSLQSNPNKPVVKNDPMVDLTSLIFKEQQQGTALDALIGVVGDNNNNTIGDVNFDPLAVDDEQPVVMSSHVDVANEKQFSAEFTQMITTYIKYLAPLFSEELIPISAKTQKKVPIPQGLDLDECIYDLDLDADKPLFDEKTHPLFPIGQHLVTNTYISSKDLDKRDQASDVNNKNNGKDNKKAGFAFSSADFEGKNNNGNSNNNINNNGNYHSNEDDDIFEAKKQRKKGDKSSNAEIDARHKNDPFYIGSSGKTTTAAGKKQTAVKSSLTLDDLEGDGFAPAPKKKMAIKKQQTKAVLDVDDDDDNGITVKKMTQKAPVDPLNDLLEPAKPVKGKKKKAAANNNVQVTPEDTPAPIVKKKTKKASTTAPAAEAQSTSIPPQSPTNAGPLAPFHPPPGTIPIHQSPEINIYARARPFVQNIDLDNESISQPIILLAITIVANPDIDTSLSMCQFSLHGNQATQVLTSPVPQQSTSVQSVIGNNASNIVHIQAKNINSQNSVTGYCAIQWNSQSISTSSRYFNFDLKFMLNGELIKFVNPVTGHNQLTLPTSIFIQPQKVPMSHVQSILTSSDNQCNFSETYIATCENQQGVMAILKGIEVALNLSLSEAANKTAVYYGHCVTLPPVSNHVFAYIKYTDDSRVHITLKSSSQVLSKKLIEDAIELLQLEEDL